MKKSWHIFIQKINSLTFSQWFDVNIHDIRPLWNNLWAFNLLWCENEYYSSSTTRSYKVRKLLFYYQSNRFAQQQKIFFSLFCSFSATATQLANHLNQLTNCTRNYINSESLKTNFNAAQLDTLRSVNLLRIKELKMEDLSTLSMDFLSSKCTKCKFSLIKSR